MSIKQLDIRFVGFFLLFGFSSAFSGEAAAMWSGSSWMLDVVANVSRIVVFVGAVLFARRVPTLLGRSFAIKTSALCMSVFSVAFFVAVAFSAVSFAFWASLGAAAVVNVAFSILYLAWMEAYARMNVYHVLVYFTAAHLLSSLFSSFVLGLGSLLAVALIMAVAPIMSALMLARGSLAYAEADSSRGEVQSAAWSISPRPLVLLVVFSFASTFARSSLSTHGSLAVRFSVCALSLAVLVCVIVRFERVELKWLYQISVPLMVAGVLGVIVSPQWGEAAGAAASSAGMVLFMTFVTGIFCSISYRFGVSAIWLFGFTQASMTAGSLLAHGVDLAFASFLRDPAVASGCLAVLAIVLVAVSMLLVSDRDFKSTWGIEPEEKGSFGYAREPSLEERCDLMARRFGLTRREEEILAYLVRGDTLARIGQELFIADSTMKTHSRHIYRKIGVENKQALRDFVEGYRM